MNRAELPPIAVLAGGRGTRLGNRTASVPKPLVEVGGEPFLFHLLRRLAKAGASRIVLCVGHLGEQIEATVGVRRFGLEIAYSYDEPGLSGTLGALRLARPLLGNRFLVHYGDTLLSLSIPVMLDTWDRSSLPAILAVLRNQGRWGPSNTNVSDGLVVAHDKVNPQPTMAWVDYGIAGLSTETLDDVDSRETDLSSLYTRLADIGRLGAFPVTDRFYEIGTPSALDETAAHLAAARESKA